jgi:hypothetical protein
MVSYNILLTLVSTIGGFTGTLICGLSIKILRLYTLHQTYLGCREGERFL